MLVLVPAPSDQIHQSVSLSHVPSTGVALSPIVEGGQVFHEASQVVFSSSHIVDPAPITSSDHDMISQTNTAALSRNILRV